jgi:hypothetical protein
MKVLIISLFLSLNLSTFGQQKAFFDAAEAIFSTYVSGGKVDYAAIKKNPEKLNSALNIAKNMQVSTADPEVYKAFWINAYNLAVIKGIVDKYPIASPLDIPGFFDVTTYNLGGQEITLNNIENELLRANFPEEARFHFALVCAGLSCPPIIDSAYRPKTLEAQLQNQTKLSLNNPDFIKINGNNIAVSMIFKWYEEDFEKEGSVLTFINTFRNEKLPKDATLSYYNYDWALNEKK